MTKTSGQREPTVAVVGMGYWGKNLVRNFHALGALHSVCDSAYDREGALAQQYPGTRYTADFETVLADPSIQGVVLATPAILHAEMATKALAAGKDVFVEKPLALSVKEGEALVQMARQAGRILMVGHILRFHAAVMKLKAMINNGDLGQVRYIYSNRLNIGKIRTEENILWSFAPHDISVILSLLGEMPTSVTCLGGAWLHRDVDDVTMSQFEFPSGVRAHIFVSWLHPVKEQKLVVVGSEKMAVFDDTAADKLLLYPHRVEWKNRIPTAVKAEAEVVSLEDGEPLRAECRHFLDCIQSRETPITDGEEGLRVLKILDACQQSLRIRGGQIRMDTPAVASAPSYFVHETARVDDGAEIGAGTKIWHYSHVMKGAHIGKGCILGQNVNVDGGTAIGNRVKIQNNVSIYTGTVIEDEVFLGPSCVLTNVTNPRSQVNRHSLYETTTIRRGATIGANATVVCGVTIGRYAFIGAGAVVTRDVPDYALVVGNPGKQVGWMSRHGQRLGEPDADGIMRCPESEFRYRLDAKGRLTCLDLGEDDPLPEQLARGSKSYREFKAETK